MNLPVSELSYMPECDFKLILDDLDTDCLKRFISSADKKKGHEQKVKAIMAREEVALRFVPDVKSTWFRDFMCEWKDITRKLRWMI